MFQNLTLVGNEARISWSWHTAAVLRKWSVHKNDKNEWTLSASIDRADSFQLKQRPLFFNAPRRGGFLTWPVMAVTFGRDTLSARLGPPEH